MSDERKKMPSQSGAWLRSTFWDEVEVEIEEIDWLEFIEFLEADAPDIPIRSAFREGLRSQLRDFVRTRYST
jgi:hypothetical protein